MVNVYTANDVLRAEQKELQDNCGNEPPTGWLHLPEVRAWLKAHGWETQLVELDGLVERQVNESAKAKPEKVIYGNSYMDKEPDQ